MKIQLQLKRTLSIIGRSAVTLVILVGSSFAAAQLWRHYQIDPWTRDGRVRADVVQIAPDVSGLVTHVEVTNDQPVKRGQALFYIDRDRYALALRQAEAAVAMQRVALAQSRREAARNVSLGDLVAAEATEQTATRVAAGEAALAQAICARDLAALNLQRTVVIAPVDGYLSDMALQVGDYVAAGKPAMALIDAQSVRVEGYFEETKLKRVHIGQRVTVQLMGENERLHGSVQSIAMGIEDRDRAASANLLPNVNPVFNWVRLAQRVPVRITLDSPPNDVRLVVGRTATVAVDEDSAGARARP